MTFCVRRRHWILLEAHRPYYRNLGPVMAVYFVTFGRG
jgi:hypothetical protein